MRVPPALKLVKVWTAACSKASLGNGNVYFHNLHASNILSWHIVSLNCTHTYIVSVFGRYMLCSLSISKQLTATKCSFCCVSNVHKNTCEPNILSTATWHKIQNIYRCLLKSLAWSDVSSNLLHGEMSPQIPCKERRCVLKSLAQMRTQTDCIHWLSLLRVSIILTGRYLSATILEQQPQERYYLCP